MTIKEYIEQTLSAHNQSEGSQKLEIVNIIENNWHPFDESIELERSFYIGPKEKQYCLEKLNDTLEVLENMFAFWMIRSRKFVFIFDTLRNGCITLRGEKDENSENNLFLFPSIEIAHEVYIAELESGIHELVNTPLIVLMKHGFDPKVHLSPSQQLMNKVIKEKTSN